MILPDVMVFAAGRGTRLLPLTATTPKPLIAVGGVPLLDRTVAAAFAEGHRRFVVNAHHLAEQVTAHVAQLAARYPDATFAISNERDSLRDTGGGLRQALPLLAGDPILTLNADTFWQGDAPLARMRDAYVQGGAEMVLLCVRPDQAVGFARGADFRLAADGRLGRDSGEPVIYAGAALVARPLAAAGPDGPFSLARTMMDASARGTLRGVMLTGRWYHVGDPAALAACTAELSEPAL